MKGYIVCVYKSINDQNTLKDYAIKARVAVEKYKGKFLVRGGQKVTTEGENWVRTVVIEFPSFKEAKTFFNSKEYQDGWTMAKETTERNLQIIEGT